MKVNATVLLTNGSIVTINAKGAKAVFGLSGLLSTDSVVISGTFKGNTIAR